MVCDGFDSPRLHDNKIVLILILLEYGLRLNITTGERFYWGLNPYSIGIWSATRLSTR